MRQSRVENQLDRLLPRLRRQPPPPLPGCRPPSRGYQLTLSVPTQLVASSRLLRQLVDVVARRGPRTQEDLSCSGPSRYKKGSPSKTDRSRLHRTLSMAVPGPQRVTGPRWSRTSGPFVLADVDGQVGLCAALVEATKGGSTTLGPLMVWGRGWSRCGGERRRRDEFWRRPVPADTQGPTRWSSTSAPRR